MRFLVLLIAICGVASAALFARIGLEDGGMSALSLTAWRLTIASACLLGWRAFFVPSSSPNGTWTNSNRWLVAVAGIFMGLHFATWIASLGYVSIAQSTLLVSTSPLWAGLAGVFVPSLRPRRTFWIGLILASGGMWMVTTLGVAWHDSHRAWVGDLLATAGAICILPYLVLSQRLQREQGSLATITWIYTSAALSMWAVLLATKEVSFPTVWPAWASIFGMALFAQLIGHSGLNWSLKTFSAGQVAMSTLMEPVFAAALAWATLGERVTLLQGVGGAVLLIGVGVALSGRKPEEDAQIVCAVE